MKSIEDIIALFGKTNREAAGVLGLHETTMSSWRKTQCIGRECWDTITEEALKRGVVIDANVLHALCAVSGRNGRPPRGGRGHKAAREVTAQPP